ncbi:MAG: DNA ligase D [Legionella sp.]|nr:DNA ligase D [Legionella sp.]
MSLEKYNQKRNFKKTAEPKGKITRDKNNLFIIQKHAASHLHYDFRLELNGVLKSWAVPKGPCLDPTVKRLAIHVEDHPVAYGSFEGIIPKGEYGGGTVMLWDKGKWHSLDEDALKAYEKGHLRFELQAKKLKGRWDLIRFKEKEWFLIKYKDEYAKPLDDYDISEELPNSVASDQSMDEIADNYKKIWTKRGLKEAPSKAGVVIPSSLKASKFPEKISPQLATLVDEPPKGDTWIHEIKFDGYRILAFKEGDTVTMKSRNNIDWTRNFKQVVNAIKELPVKNAILDGEIVLLDAQQKSSFQLLQNAIKGDKEAPFIYYIFDLIYYDKFELKNLSLLERKKMLSALIGEDSSLLRFSHHIVGEGQEVFEKSCEAGLEGIISKRISSPYIEKRSKSWVKVKCIKRQEFVIGGYSLPRGARSYFGSLYLGVYNDDAELIYCGNVGTGFTDESLRGVFEALKKNQSENNPFNTKPPGSKKAIWLNPLLVAEVEFIEWTNEGHLRHPSFQGLRYDKKATSIKKEHEVPVTTIKQRSVKTKEKSSSFVISNPDKILYPGDGVTKQDLLNYYDEISDFILPYIKNRPLSLVRCPDNYEKCFYQKHFNNSTPKALKSIPIKSTTDNQIEPYIYLTNKEGLLSLVQMGVLEIHPWGSTNKKLEYPDILIFDLDPGPDVAWKAVVKAAFEIKKYLEELHLTPFVKTTGGKGLHVEVSIKPQFNWEEIKEFTRAFVQLLEKINPEAYISKMTKAKRGGKIFIDYLRNQRGATAIAPYSSRARKKATVATPIEWDELTSNINDTFYTVQTLPLRLRELKKDPWEAFLKLKQTLTLNELK